jgi:hypothetical protein
VAYSGAGNRVMTSSDGVTWTSRASAADNEWFSVCWAPQLGIFVAVANTGTGNRVMTSTDGVTWTARTSPADNQWNSVCWSPERGIFVAVATSGIGNRIMTSPDGFIWTLRASAADFQWMSVCWAAQRGLFVAVAQTGTGNRIMSSPDGFKWTLRTSAADNSWRGVCYSPELDRFVAVANSGTGNRAMTIHVGQTAFVEMLRIGGSNMPAARLDVTPVVTGQLALRVGTVSGGDAMVVASDGRVGINITNPTNHLDVNGDINLTGTLKKNGQAIDNMWIKDTSNNVNTTFNVGINTSIPLYNLDVNSNARIANSLTTSNINAQTIQLVKHITETLERGHPDPSFSYTFQTSYDSSILTYNNWFEHWSSEPLYQLSYATDYMGQLYQGSEFDDGLRYGSWMQINFSTYINPISFTVNRKDSSCVIYGRSNSDDPWNPWQVLTQETTSSTIPTITNTFVNSIRIIITKLASFTWNWGQPANSWDWWEPNPPPEPQGAYIWQIAITARETRTVLPTDTQGLLHLHGGDIYISKQTSSNTTSGEHGAIVFASAARNMLSNNSARIVSGYTDGTFDDTGYISLWTSANNSNAVERMRVASDGRVGIGITAPAHELDVAGTIRASGDVFAFSDCNYKYEVARINNALESVKVINGYTYRLAEGGEGGGGGARHAGVFAQEVEQVLPEVVNTDLDGKKSVAYGNMIGLLIEAIKELNKRVESLESLQKSFIK